MSGDALHLEPSGLPAPAGEPFTHEDVLRAEDRVKVLRSRAANQSWRLLWLLAGPGVLVMLGENDGPSMVSYATTGATYGVGFFAPFILLTVRDGLCRAGNDRAGRRRDPSRPCRADFPALRPVLGLFRHGRSGVRQSADAGHRIHRHSGGRPLFRRAGLGLGRARRRAGGRVRWPFGATRPGSAR